MSVSGKIAFDGATLQPPADLSRVTIRLTSAPNASGVTVTVGASGVSPAADGTFKIEGVTPGRYFVSASAPTAAPVPGTSWLVRSAMAAGVNAADLPFEVRPDQDVSDVLVTFTDKVAELSGTLLDAAGHPTSEFSVILFTADRSMWSQRSRRLRPPIRTSTEGKFKFSSLMAGDYYIAALSDFEPSDYYNPAFLEQVAAAATKVTVAEGEKKVQDLKIAAAPGPGR